MTRPRIDFGVLREQVPFDLVLRKYGIALRGAGTQRLVLCPFHEDGTPSLSVNLERKLFHCFACGAKGDVIDFVVKMEGCALPDAAHLIAQWCGVSVKRTETARNATCERGALAPQDDCEKPANKPLPFTLRLDPEHPYLKKRGVSREVAVGFGLGYCAEGSMKGRICIPIHDHTGTLVAYAGRWPGEPPPGEPRYLLPRGFKKSEVVFNLHRVDRAKHLVVVEGYWSVFRLHALGIPAVALMGCTLSATQEELLAASHARLLTLLFDGDPAGRTGAAAISPRLTRRCFAHMAELPDGTQPDTVPTDHLRRILRAP